MPLWRFIGAIVTGVESSISAKSVASCPLVSKSIQFGCTITLLTPDANHPSANSLPLPTSTSSNWPLVSSSTQCAAVSTQSGAMSVPEQNPDGQLIQTTFVC